MTARDDGGNFRQRETMIERRGSHRGFALPMKALGSGDALIAGGVMCVIPL
jgi:hypothetical protein